MARQTGRSNHRPDRDLREALRVLRRGFGEDQVVVLATIRHGDRSAQARPAPRRTPAPPPRSAVQLPVAVGRRRTPSGGQRQLRFQPVAVEGTRRSRRSPQLDAVADHPGRVTGACAGGAAPPDGTRPPAAATTKGDKLTWVEACC